MATLLHVDSIPLYGQSVSRELTGAFVRQWRASHPDSTVIDRDLTFLTAGGTMALNQGQDRQAFLAPYLQAVQTHAQGL